MTARAPAARQVAEVIARPALPVAAWRTAHAPTVLVPAESPATPGQAGQSAPLLAVGGVTARVDANSTMWRLRSLVAMGHDATRIARALNAHPPAIRDLIRGDATKVSPQLRDLTCQLWDAWWDKRPPERTPAERRAASYARHRAGQRGWCTPLGLDEDQLDEPGYRPYTKYRRANGAGVAANFRPKAGRTSKEIS